MLEKKKETPKHIRLSNAASAAVWLLYGEHIYLVIPLTYAVSLRRRLLHAGYGEAACDPALAR